MIKIEIAYYIFVLIIVDYDKLKIVLIIIIEKVENNEIYSFSRSLGQ